MKIKVPFRMFGNQEGWIELDIPINPNIDVTDERQEERVKEIAEGYARLLGVFRDTFQTTILGYERCPGIGQTFLVLKMCQEDEILKERIMELLSEWHKKAMHGDEE